MTSRFYYKNTRSVKISKAALRNSIIAVMIALIVASPIVYAGSSFAFHTQYNLPLPSPLEHQPSYAIRIPFGATETDTGYEPANVSIPAGMTVGWFNDDSAEHTVTALTNESEQGGSSPDPLAPLLTGFGECKTWCRAVRFRCDTSRGIFYIHVHKTWNIPLL